MSASTLNPPAAGTVAADYGFQQSDTPQGRRFVVTPPSHGGAGVAYLAMVWIMVGLGGGFVGGFLLYALGYWLLGVNLNFVFCFLLAGGGLGVLAHRSIRKGMSKATQTVTLTLTPAGLDVDGKLYGRADIREIWMTSPEEDSSTSVTVSSNAWQAGGQQAGRDVGQAIGKKFRERGFGVAIRYGGQKVMVVNFLTEGVATELTQRLSAGLRAGAT